MYSFFAHFNFILASRLSLLAHIVRYSFFAICDRQIGICSPLMLSAFAYSRIMSYHVMIDRFSLGSWHLQHARLIVHSVIVGHLALTTAASAPSKILRSSGLLVSITGMLPVLNMTYHVSNILFSALRPTKLRLIHSHSPFLNCIHVVTCLNRSRQLYGGSIGNIAGIFFLRNMLMLMLRLTCYSHSDGGR